MTTFELNEKIVEEAMDLALFEGANVLMDEVIKITPRDPQRPPKNPKVPVTGNLKKSIGTEKKSKSEYLVGVRQGFYNTEEYGYYQEYGTIRIPPRSFLRKALLEQGTKVMETMQNVFSQYIDRAG